MIINKYNIC